MATATLKAVRAETRKHRRSAPRTTQRPPASATVVPGFDPTEACDATSYLLLKGEAASAFSAVYRAVQWAAISAALLTAACGGGGAGGIAPATAITGNSPSAGSGSGTSSSGGSTGGGSGTGGSSLRNSVGIDTGIPGWSVGAPAPASFGAAPLPAQIATSGGPTFDGSSGSFPSNVSFPAAASSLQFQSPWDYNSIGASAVTTSQSATVTVISISATSASLQLIVPAVNLNTTINFNENLVRNIDGVTWGLSYVALGGWSQPAGGPLSFTEFLFGYETPVASMPTTGQAAFSGYADANIFGPGNSKNGDVWSNWASGNAALTVDFASGKITGAFTHMQYLESSSYVPWNDVSVNASILSGTNKFSGSTGVTSTPQTPFSLKGSATGHIDGGFYGPSAQNLGAIWSLSDGTTTAIGGVAAGR
jgi:hypothetical protein